MVFSLTPFNLSFHKSIIFSPNFQLNYKITAYSLRPLNGLQMTFEFKDGVQVIVSVFVSNAKKFEFMVRFIKVRRKVHKGKL